MFDLGGGTLDVSIVESSNDGKSILVKAVDGDPLLGGRDFDEISIASSLSFLILLSLFIYLFISLFSSSSLFSLFLPFFSLLSIILFIIK